MIFVNSVRAPSESGVLLRHLDDFHPGFVNPRGAGVIATDVGESFCDHGT